MSLHGNIVYADTHDLYDYLPSASDLEHRLSIPRDSRTDTCTTVFKLETKRLYKFKQKRTTTAAETPIMTYNS